MADRDAGRTRSALLLLALVHSETGIQDVRVRAIQIRVPGRRPAVTRPILRMSRAVSMKGRIGYRFTPCGLLAEVIRGNMKRIGTAVAGATTRFEARLSIFDPEEANAGHRCGKADSIFSLEFRIVGNQLLSQFRLSGMRQYLRCYKGQRGLER